MSRAALLHAVGWTVCLSVLLANAWPHLETTVDDAWISARYALHLAEGYGLTYNAAAPAVEGYSNPLWTAWIAVGLSLGLPPSPWMTWTGLGFAAVCLWAARGWARALAGREHPTLWGVPLALALSPQIAVATTNGLETGMWLAALAGAGWVTLAAERPLSRVAAGLLVGSLAAVRPEGLAVAGLLVAVDLWRRRDRLGDPSTWTLAGTAAAFVVLFIGWRLMVYGAPLPNTVAAKANPPLDRLVSMNLRYLGYDGATWPVVGVLLVLAPLLPPRTTARWVPSLVGLGCWAAALQVILWMPGARLMLPGLLCAAVGCGAAAASGEQRWRWAVAALPTAVCLGVLLTDAHDLVRAYDGRNTVVPDNPASLAARHLAEHAPDGATLAVRDAGVVAFWAGTGITVAETHQRALTQPHPGGENLDMARLLPAPPELLVTTVQRLDHERPRYGNDRWVLRRWPGRYRWLGRVEQHYHRFYDVWVRRDVALPDLPEELLAPYEGPVPR